MAPDASFLCWVDFSGVDASHAEFFQFMTDCDFFVSDGNFFGPGGEKHFRLNVGLPAKALDIRGKATVDERNNQVIFTDIAEKVKQARAIVDRIDRVTSQVIIEARVVEANSARDTYCIEASIKRSPSNRDFGG